MYDQSISHLIMYYENYYQNSSHFERSYSTSFLYNQMSDNLITTIDILLYNPLNGTHLDFNFKNLFNSDILFNYV